MPKLFRILDNQTGRTLVRHGRDAREILGHDAGRYVPADDAAKKLRPVYHEDRIRLTDDEVRELPKRRPQHQIPVTVADSAPASATPPPPAPAKKQPSQETVAKRNAALAKAREARKAKEAEAQAAA